MVERLWGPVLFYDSEAEMSQIVFARRVNALEDLGVFSGINFDTSVLDQRLPAGAIGRIVVPRWSFIDGAKSYLDALKIVLGAIARKSPGKFSNELVSYLDEKSAHKLTVRSSYTLLHHHLTTSQGRYSSFVMPVFLKKLAIKESIDSVSIGSNQCPLDPLSLACFLIMHPECVDGKIVVPTWKYFIDDVVCSPMTASSDGSIVFAGMANHTRGHSDTYILLTQIG